MESVSPIENCIVRHVNTNKTQIIHKRLVNGLFQVFLLEISALDLHFDLLVDVRDVARKCTERHNFSAISR